MKPRPAPVSASAKKVPEELLKQLHEANQRFHQSKEQLESAMNGVEYRHQERINDAEEELRRAEKKVEEVEDEIRKELGKN